MERYFCSVEQTLKAKTPQKQSSLITVAEITEEDVFNTCNHLKTSLGSRLNNISSFFI